MTINIMKKLSPISKSNAALSSRRCRVVFASLVCQPVLFDLDREERAKRKSERMGGRLRGSGSMGGRKGESER